MIIDTSALIAMMLNEAEAPHFERLLASAQTSSMSAANYLEAGIVVDSQHNPVVSRALDRIISVAEIAIVPVTEEHALIARRAYQDFGRGSGHPAQLNFGDCFAYALAATTGEPLLFKGDDFTETDISRARLGREQD